MKYFNEKSNKGIVNLFADFLVKEINKTNQHDVVIEVTDCGKFLVVNGMTSSSKILDMVQIKDNFVSEYETLLTDFGYSNGAAFLAASMNPQVLTSTASALCASSVRVQPPSAKRAASSSESTSLRAQPSVTSATVREEST